MHYVAIAILAANGICAALNIIEGYAILAALNAAVAVLLLVLLVEKWLRRE